MKTPAKIKESFCLSVLVVLAALVLSGCADESAATSVRATGERMVAPATLAAEPLARFAGRDPGLAMDAGGRLHTAYVAEDEAGPYVAYRAYDGALGEPVRVSPPGLLVSARGEVPPVVEVLGETLLVAYRVSLDSQWTGELRVQLSDDQGATWGAPTLLHDDGKLGSHSFLDATVNARGEAVLAWLDNRDGQQGLYTATALADGAIRANRTVDTVTCQCCATALHTGSGGRVYLAYRDLDGGGEDGAGVRDVRLAVSGDGGESFAVLGTVADDGWRINACPHTGPRLESGTDGALWVAWFTGAEPAGIYVAASRDGGTSFLPRRALASGTGVAHPEIARLPDGRLALFYEEHGAAGGAVAVRLADPAGEAWGAPRRLLESAAYPRFASDGRRAILASTVRRGDGLEVVLLGLGTES